MTAGEVAGWVVVVLIILFSLIQISPLRLNPWDSILGWLGRKINGETEKQLKELKKQVTIKISPSVIAYFKTEASETGIPYQTLINLYLIDCVKNKRKLNINWEKEAL